MFRLELLENIFSLLFLSTADLAQQKDANSNTCSVTQQEHLSDTTRDSENKHKPCEVENEESQKSSMKAPSSHYLGLSHFVQGCRGFLVDETAIKGFLKLLKDGLEGMSASGQQDGQDTGRASPPEAEVAERIGCSVKAETFGTRLQRLSKYIAEAQWRLQIITSNQGGGSGEKSMLNMFLFIFNLNFLVVCFMPPLFGDVFYFEIHLSSHF